MLKDEQLCFQSNTYTIIKNFTYFLQIYPFHVKYIHNKNTKKKYHILFNMFKLRQYFKYVFKLLNSKLHVSHIILSLL